MRSSPTSSLLFTLLPVDPIALLLAPTVLVCELHTVEQDPVVQLLLLQHCA